MKVENTRWAIAIYNQVLTYYNVKCSRQNVLFKNISTLYNFSFIILLVSGVFFFLLKIYWRLETDSLVFRDRAQRKLEIHKPQAPGKDNFRLCPQQTIGPWPSTAANKLTNLCEHVFFFFIEIIIAMQKLPNAIEACSRVGWNCLVFCTRNIQYENMRNNFE